MQRRIPIFRLYPVRLSLTPTEQVAEGEAHPEVEAYPEVEAHPEVEATASTISSHIRNEVGFPLIKLRTTNHSRFRSAITSREEPLTFLKAIRQGLKGYGLFENIACIRLPFLAEEKAVQIRG